MMEKILIIRDNPYYKRKKELNKNEKILKYFWISKKQMAEFIGRHCQTVYSDFRNVKNMRRLMSWTDEIKWIFYAEKLAEITGENIDKNIFL